MNSISIPMPLFRALCAIAPRKDIRKHLQGIAVQPVGLVTKLYATDGHVAMLAQCDNDEPVESPAFILPIADALIAAKSQVPHVVIAPLGLGRFTVRAGATRLEVTGIDADFPDIDRLVPRTFSNVAASFDPAILCKVAAAGRALGEKLCVPSMTYNGDSAAMARFKSTDAFCIIMPYRAIPYDSAPEWFCDRQGWSKADAKKTAKPKK